MRLTGLGAMRKQQMQKPEDTIKFVKEYLAYPSSKTLEEVQANYDAAARYAAADTTVYAARYAAADAVYAYAVSYAAAAARYAARYAADYAADARYADHAAYWVKRYEERKHRVAAWSRKG